MFKHALVLMSLLSAVAACGDPEPATVDAASNADAAPVVADASPAATIVSEQTDAEWRALCEELFTPELNLGVQAPGCAGEDCEASNTAVQDCVAALELDPQDCEPPPVGNPLRECDATVAQLKNCFATFFNQFLPYASATCENVDEISPPRAPNTLEECNGFLTKCPDAFSGN